MTVPKMLHILSMGNRKGSALKELSDYYGCENYDLSPISDDMADAWLIRKREGYDGKVKTDLLTTDSLS